jgi:hypothetical protein
MSFTETLFGGLLSIVALYFILRRLGLSNYWSALIAGAVPWIAYIGYSMSHGFAGDVLAIHMAVFMATAGVLGVFGATQRKGEKMHWAPKLLIVFFVGLVAFNAMLLSVSMHGLPQSVFDWFLPKPDKVVTVHTGFPGAVPSDRNKLYEPHLQRIEQQRQLGWKLTVAGLDRLHKGQAEQVSLTLLDKAGMPLENAKITLDLWRMANSADDQRLQLVEQGKGQYGLPLNLKDAGKWIAEIYIERGQDTYRMQQPITVAE